MSLISAKWTAALAVTSVLALGLAGCGDELRDSPDSTPYVAPPPPGEMKPPPKQKKGRPRSGVPLSLHPAETSVPGGPTTPA
ncbi:hypothetical protein [Paludisphaera sp.]|uniref:hypothetical protein n=1 Tax=Paludisphaera sp. TaxID=2017432 RepID=UPI00301C767A